MSRKLNTKEYHPSSTSAILNPDRLARGHKLPALKTKITAIRDFVWLKSIDDEVSDGGIIIPNSAMDTENPLEGVVVAVGTGLIEGGIEIPLKVKVGDHVHFPRNAGTLVRVKETGETFFVCRENIIFGATA